MHVHAAGIWVDHPDKPDAIAEPHPRLVEGRDVSIRRRLAPRRQDRERLLGYPLTPAVGGNSICGNERDVWLCERCPARVGARTPESDRRSIPRGCAASRNCQDLECNHVCDAISPFSTHLGIRSESTPSDQLTANTLAVQAKEVVGGQQPGLGCGHRVVLLRIRLAFRQDAGHGLINGSARARVALGIYDFGPKSDRSESSAACDVQFDRAARAAVWRSTPRDVLPSASRLSVRFGWADAREALWRNRESRLAQSVYGARASAS